MGDDNAVEEFPDEEQRRAVCETQWEEGQSDDVSNNDSREAKMRPRRSIFKAQARKGSYRVENKETDATMYLYDEIGWFGVEAEKFVKDINAITADTIHLRINSPGGSVFDGMSIYNTLKQHKARIVAHIDGLAASITSVIAMGADEIRASDESYIMIHEPWSIMIGNSEDMHKEGDLLEKIGGTISQTYQKKTGKGAEEINALMAGESWFTGAEAHEIGLVDVIEEIEEDKKAKMNTILFDLSAFANVPDGLMAEGKQTPSERELEKILRDAGCSRAQAKAILATGLPEDLRDAEASEELESSEAQGSQRDAEAPADLRDADPPKETGKDRVADLLIRAEQLKSTLNGGYNIENDHAV